MAAEKPDYFTEIARTVDLRTHVAVKGTLNGTVISGLDLRDPEIEASIIKLTFDDAVLLGCQVTPDLARRVRQSGGLMFPIFEDLPFNPYRSELYSVGELMEGYVRGHPDSLSETLDAAIFQYFKSRHSGVHAAPVLETLACRIHDHAIDRALDDLLRPSEGDERRVVGIMGGHKLGRDAPDFRTVASIARLLTRNGLFVATGGGPGAMEAGNLGAWFAEKDEQDLDTAVNLLAPSPRYADPQYVDRGFDVLDMQPTGQDSLAVPTWFYGHEPSNLFATSIAKYFANSIREDGLLAIATYGVIYSPGSAGTIQEVFLDAAQNHYASLGIISPMVFLGVDYWTRIRPVFPLLQLMSDEKPYGTMIAVTDDPIEAVQFIMAHPPSVEL